MPTQITIVGLGQIGASMGLAMAAHRDSILRVGHDKKAEVERDAVKRGVVDKAEHNLPAAVEDARLVVLCLPLSQVRETLEVIVHDLKPGTVVLDISPVKSEVIKWAKELLPEGCHYIGLVPSINPEHIHDLHIGLDAAKADLFTKGLFLVDAPSGTPGEAVTLASDFIRLLGANPLLSDPVESDGLMASTHLLPQLVSAALLNATIDQPGWQEARKVAGRAYATVTSGVAYQDEIDSLRLSSIQDRASILHALDVMIASLRGLRDDIDKSDDDGLAERLETALEGRQRWLNERFAADWLQNIGNEKIDIPSFTERLLGSMFAKRTKQ